MLEKFKEFRKDFSERIRSPFISALIISWSIYNWKIYYLMFYNAEVISLEKRIVSIQCYLCCRSQWNLIWWPIIAAFIGLLILNISKSIGLGISLLYENWASPWIQKWLYNEKIVEKHKHETLKRQFNRLREEMNQKEDLYVQNSKDIQEIEGNFKQYKFNSIPTRSGNLNELFDPEYEWFNKYYDSRNNQSGEIRFTNEFHGLKEIGREELLPIKNIKINNDGVLVTFEKHFSDIGYYLNILTRDNEGNYIGVENGIVKIQYIKGDKKPNYRVK